MRILYNPIVKIFLTRSLIFVCRRLVGILDKNILPDLITALCFDLAAHNLRTSVLDLPSNPFKN